MDEEKAGVEVVESTATGLPALPGRSTPNAEGKQTPRRSEGAEWWPSDSTVLRGVEAVSAAGVPVPVFVALEIAQAAAMWRERGRKAARQYWDEATGGDPDWEMVVQVAAELGVEVGSGARRRRRTTPGAPRP